MPRFFPPAFPPELATRPAYAGEKRVWEALRRARLGDEICVFYNRAPEGCRRRADVLIVDPGRGIIAIEVKGGPIQYRDGFRQWLPDENFPKLIQPWMQAGRAMQQAFAALKLNAITVPFVPVFAAPHMRRHQFPFELPPRMITAENLASVPLARKLDGLLPRLDGATREKLAPVFESIIAALTRPGDETSEYVAYAVRCGRPSIRAGAAYHQADGLTVELDILPLDFDGRIVLVERNVDLTRLPGTLPA